MELPVGTQAEESFKREAICQKVKPTVMDDISLSRMNKLLFPWRHKLRWYSF